MHELLAPIVFVLHCDHQAFQHASETANPRSDLITTNMTHHSAVTLSCEGVWAEHMKGHSPFLKILKNGGPPLTWAEDPLTPSLQLSTLLLNKTLF